MALRAVVYVVEHNNTGYEVYCLPCGEEVQIGPAVPPPVTIAGVMGQGGIQVKDWKVKTASLEVKGEEIKTVPFICDTCL